MAIGTPPATIATAGTIPFDAAVARNTLLVIAANLQNFQNLFPDNSKEQTGALPAVWTNRAAFVALANKTVTDATAGSGQLATLAAMKASKGLSDALADCDACHKAFRNF